MSDKSFARRIAEECAFRSICPGGHGDAAKIELAIEHVIERCAQEAEQIERYSLGKLIGSRIRALAAPPAGVGAEATHVWVKPTMEGGWTCTVEARGRAEVKCERKAAVFCEEDHGNGTCLEGRCREHAPAGTGGRR